MNEEQADFDQSAAGFRKLQRVLDNRPLVALAVVLAGLAAAIVLYGLAWLLYGREPEGEDSAVTYFPEPPDDAPPAVALALTNQGNAGPGDGDALAATLLDLIVRGRFKTRVGDGEHGPDLLLEQGDPSVALADHETPVVAIVESVLKDEPIPLSELGHRLGELSASQRTSNASRKSQFVSARGRLIKAERKQFRVPRADAIARFLAFVVFGLGVLAIIIGAAQYASHPAWNPLKWILIGGVVATFGFLVLTAPRSLWVSTRRESLPRIARWEAFRRYLEELPRLSDESPITLGTWEKLLVYATAFGCAERVAEAARLRGWRGRDGGLGRRHVGRAAVRPLVELRDGGRQRARPGAPRRRSTATSAVRCRPVRPRPRRPARGAAVAAPSAAAAAGAAEAVAAAPGRRRGPAPGPRRGRRSAPGGRVRGGGRRRRWDRTSAPAAAG